MKNACYKMCCEKTLIHWKITHRVIQKNWNPRRGNSILWPIILFSFENYILILVLASTFVLNSRLKSLSHFTSSFLKAHLKGKRYTIPNLQLVLTYVSKFWQIWYCMKLIFLELDQISKPRPDQIKTRTTLVQKNYTWTW